MPDLAKNPIFARRFLIIAASVFVFAAAIYGSLRLYRKLEPMRLAKRARTYWDKGDFTNAALTLRQATSINPNDLSCARLIAEIAESRGDIAAIGWRNRLVDLQPGSSTAVFECADTALRFGQPAIAEEVLGKIRGSERENPRYHEIFGQAALALNKPGLAVEHFQKALSLDAANESHQLNCAAALLARGWLEDRAPARATLEKLGATPKLGAPALRALVKDSIANHDSVTAIGLVRKLTGRPEAIFSDQMTLLNLLQRTRSPEVSQTLAALKTSARGKPSEVAELIFWINNNVGAREAIEWSDEFATEEWADPKVCAAVTTCVLTLRDWARLEALTGGGKWGNLEYVRRALRARALREQGRDSEASQHWAAALAAVAGQPEATAALARLVADWGWSVEFEGLLRDMLNDPKEFGWASRVLLGRLANKKDTEGLWDVTARVIAASPADDAAANNFAMFSLLLGRDVPRACLLARKLYETHPHEAKYVSTYAFSLHVLNQSGEAVQIMRSLAPDQLETPDVAAYCGILLAATGDREKAAKFLDLAKGARLLPEEAELVRKARRQLE